MKIVILGPAWPFRGGIAAFNERLARELMARGAEVKIITYTLQYPSILFPGKTQRSGAPRPEDLDIEERINSINPFNWLSVRAYLGRLEADKVIVPFWQPFMAPSLAFIAKGKEKIGLLHNLLPHERKPGSRLLSKYFCSRMDRFVALSGSVARQASQLCGDAASRGGEGRCGNAASRRGELHRPKTVTVSPHPVYDSFGDPEPREEACRALNLPSDKPILLFFGLVREYKGLDLLLKAYARVKDSACLVIAGEFYEDARKYHELARSLGVDPVWRSEYIPDSQVRHYFCAADLTVQPYRSATQSGVTQIAYHFEKPMLVTNVGGLAEMVPDGVCGYVVAPDPDTIAAALENFVTVRPDFSAGLREEKRKYSWETFCNNLL